MAPQRQWKIHQQQQALLEFSDMSTHCPPGVYLSYHPSNPSQWSGVYFVRKGSYATAVLRFKLVLPENYPQSAPALIFSNDLFHPLICPLTTYTYSSARQPVSSADDQRLSPGSLNLQHQFPIWFGAEEGNIANSGVATSPRPSNSHDHDEPTFSDDEFNQVTPADRYISSQGKMRLFMPPPKPDALEWSSAQRYPSIAEILRYMVQTFENEELLDNVPLDAAANPSAHHAYAAYRKRVKEAEAVKESAKARTGDSPAPATPQRKFARGHLVTASPGRSPAAWNWDGVWQERVKNSVRSATADGKLYKDDEAGEHQLITFLDREKEDINIMKKEALKSGKSMAAYIAPSVS